MNTIAPLLLDRLEATVSELARTIAQLKDSSARDEGDSNPKPAAPEYLSVKELASRIPYSEHTIRNLMSAGEFAFGVHYFKRRGRVIFSWQAMRKWVEQGELGQIAEVIPLVRSRYARSR